MQKKVETIAQDAHKEPLSLKKKHSGMGDKEILDFSKFATRLLPDGWVELKVSGCRCYFWAFQVELDPIDTKNFEIGSVGTKLQPCNVG